MIEKQDRLIIEDGNGILWEFEVLKVNENNRTVEGFLIKDGKRFGLRKIIQDHQITQNLSC